MFGPFRLPGVEENERSYGLEELQAPSHADHAAAAQALFKALGAEIRHGEDTNRLLQIYPLAEAFGTTRREVEDRLRLWLERIGWQYKIFGPDEAGNGWTNPDFLRESYHTRTVWIFQPSVPAGSFRDYAYTLAWRVTHEVAHALVNDQLVARYGILGRRLGRLGKRKVYRAEGRPQLATTPLTLSEVLRAVEWEHHAFRKQREILETEFGIRITDEAFAKENLVNTADATYRCLTGHFSSPGDLGVVPTALDPEEVITRSTDLLWWAAWELGVATLQGGGVGARYLKVTVPLPIADEAGARFPAHIRRWFESRLREIGAGFRRHGVVEGVREKGAGTSDSGAFVVYTATIPVDRFPDVAELVKQAHTSYRQVIELEVTPVEHFLFGGGEAEMPDLTAETIPRRQDLRRAS